MPHPTAWSSEAVPSSSDVTSVHTPSKSRLRASPGNSSYRNRTVAGSLSADVQLSSILRSVGSREPVPHGSSASITSKGRARPYLVQDVRTALLSGLHVEAFTVRHRGMTTQTLPILGAFHLGQVGELRAVAIASSDACRRGWLMFGKPAGTATSSGSFPVRVQQPGRSRFGDHREGTGQIVGCSPSDRRDHRPDPEGQLGIQ